MEGYLIYMERITGFEKIVYWTKEEVIRHALDKSPSYKPTSQNFKKSAWFTDFDAMAMKTVIRSLNKYMPMSIDFITAINNDQSEDEPVQSEPVNITMEGMTKGAAQVAKALPDKSVSAENAHTEDSSKTEQTGLTKEEQQKAEQEEEDEYLKAINDES